MWFTLFRFRFSIPEKVLGPGKISTCFLVASCPKAVGPCWNHTDTSLTSTSPGTLVRSCEGTAGTWPSLGDQGSRGSSLGPNERRLMDAPQEGERAPSPKKRLCSFTLNIEWPIAYITKGSLSYLSSPCFSKNVLQSGVGIVHWIWSCKSWFCSSGGGVPPPLDQIPPAPVHAVVDFYQGYLWLPATFRSPPPLSSIVWGCPTICNSR